MREKFIYVVADEAHFLEESRRVMISIAIRWLLEPVPNAPKQPDLKALNDDRVSGLQVAINISATKVSETEVVMPPNRKESCTAKICLS